MCAAFLDSIADDGPGIASVTGWEMIHSVGRLNPDLSRRDPAERFRDLPDKMIERRPAAWTSADAQSIFVKPGAKDSKPGCADRARTGD